MSSNPQPFFNKEISICRMILIINIFLQNHLIYKHLLNILESFLFESLINTANVISEDLIRRSTTLSLKHLCLSGRFINLGIEQIFVATL